MTEDATVTDQLETEAKPPDELDFSNAFSDAIVGGDGSEADTDEETKTDEEEETSEKDERSETDTKKDEDETKSEKSEDDTKSDEETAGDDELSEEDKAANDRGKTLIKEEDQATKDAETQAEEDKQKLAQEEADRAAGEVNPVTADQVKNFVGMILPSELPDTIELDGVNYDVKEYMEENPAAQVVSGMVTQKILERLVENGVVITADQYKKEMQSLSDQLYGLRFNTTVLRALPDAEQLVEMEEYEPWMKDKATKEDLALLGSIEPNDYILGLKKFKGFIEGDKPKASDKSKTDAKTKSAKEKENHDSIHSSTMSAINKTDTKGSMESGSEDFSDAFKEAEAKAEKDKK